jgi:hypothetical protein
MSFRLGDAPPHFAVTAMCDRADRIWRGDHSSITVGMASRCRATATHSNLVGPPFPRRPFFSGIRHPEHVPVEFSPALPPGQPSSRSIPTRRNSGSVARRRLRTSGLSRRRSTSHRRLPGSHTPPAWRISGSRSWGNGRPPSRRAGQTRRDRRGGEQSALPSPLPYSPRHAARSRAQSTRKRRVTLVRRMIRRRSSP